jgi:hypothetical protein
MSGEIVFRQRLGAERDPMLDLDVIRLHGIELAALQLVFRFAALFSS